MGVYIDWSIEGGHSDGTELTSDERCELSKAISEYCHDDIEPDGSYLVSFCTTSLWAYDEIKKAIGDYASKHPNINLDITYRNDCDDCSNVIEVRNGVIAHKQGRVVYDESKSSW